MAAVLYTTIAAIRATVGITAQDVTDAQINDRAPGVELEIDLGTWLPTHATIASEGQAQQATPTQKSKWNLLLMYAQYFSAAILLESQLYLIPMSVSDGTNSISRFYSQQSLKMHAAAQQKAEYYKSMLLDTLGTDSTARVTQFGSKKPAYDPVTNITS